MKKFPRLILIAAVIFISACSGVSVVTESDHLKERGVFTVIQLGWLDFDKSSWRAFGFESPAEWNRVIADVNEKVLRPQIRGRLGGKKIIPAAAGSKSPDKTAEVTVQFLDTKIDRGYRFGSGPWGSITTTVIITDLKAKRIIYRAQVTGSQSNVFSFDAQMMGAAHNISRFVAEKLK